MKKDEMTYEDDLNQALLKDFLWIQELGKEEKLSWDSSLTDLCIWIHPVSYIPLTLPTNTEE